MGDRANIVVKRGEEQVVLYTHWNGSELPETLRLALKRGESRWHDFQYLTRIIFCQMIPSEYWAETTGFGISCKIYDNEYEIITVDVDKRTVQIGGGKPVSFAKYVENE